MKPLNFRTHRPTPAQRYLQMAAHGYGWEDICVQWDIKMDSLVAQLIRRMVLERGKHGDRYLKEYG